MNKNFVHYLVWLIPIRSLRDKISKMESNER